MTGISAGASAGVAKAVDVLVGEAFAAAGPVSVGFISAVGWESDWVASGRTAGVALGSMVGREVAVGSRSGAVSRTEVG